MNEYSWGAIVRPVRKFEDWGDNSDKTIIQNRAEIGGLLLAVLGSNDDEDRRWTWKGIHEWKRKNLRYFPARMEKQRKILIV